MRKFVLMAVLAIFPLGLFAARLTLRDGTVVYGRFVSGTTQDVTFQQDNGISRRFSLNQVQSIEFTPADVPAAAAYPPQQPYPPQQNYPNQAYREDQRGYGRDWATIVPGTELWVRTDQRIDSGNAAAGATFPATIVQDVLDRDGNIVIPRGSPATLVVRQVNAGGTLSNGNFVLDLDSIQVNGRRHVVSTTDIEARDQNGIGANRRTGEMVGGGAVLGTLLGAIAGCGKGAAIGAVAGAATGGGVQVLTKGHEIRVPAETVLKFRLDEPLHLREAQ